MKAATDSPQIMYAYDQGLSPFSTEMNQSFSLPKWVFQFIWDRINCFILFIPRGMYLVHTLENELHVQKRFEQYLDFFGQNLHDIKNGGAWATTKIMSQTPNISTWQLFVTGWFSDRFQWLSDLQLGDDKVTVNHLV